MNKINNKMLFTCDFCLQRTNIKKKYQINNLAKVVCHKAVILLTHYCIFEGVGCFKKVVRKQNTSPFLSIVQKKRFENRAFDRAGPDPEDRI